jgi:hypothetical protein
MPPRAFRRAPTPSDRRGEQEVRACRAAMLDETAAANLAKARNAALLVDHVRLLQANLRLLRLYREHVAGMTSFVQGAYKRLHKAAPEHDLQAAFTASGTAFRLDLVSEEADVTEDAQFAGGGGTRPPKARRISA